MDLNDRWNRVNALEGSDLWRRIEERFASLNEATAAPRVRQRILAIAVASIISLGAAALLLQGSWWSNGTPARSPAEGGPATSGSDGPVASDRCTLPAVSPTTLPWVADGDPVPAPDTDELNARLNWMAPPDSEWSGSYVALRLLEESNIDGQPLESAALPDGTPGEILRFGRQWDVFWADSERYCGSIALYVLVGDRPADESRRMTVAIAESLVERQDVIERPSAA